MKESAYHSPISKLRFFCKFFSTLFFSELSNTVVARFLVLGLGFASITLITRILSVEDRGKYAVLINLFTLLMSFFAFGFQNAIVYFLSKKPALFQYFYIITFFISISSFILISILYLTGGWSFFFVELTFFDFLVVLIGFPIVLFSYFNSFFFLGKNDFYYYNLFEFIKALCFLTLILSFYNYHVVYAEYVILFVAANALHITSAFLYFVKRGFFSSTELNIKNTFNKCVDIVKHNFKFSAVSYISNILYVFISRYSLFFLGAFKEVGGLDRETLGYYSVALATMDILTLVPSTLAFFIFPKISAAETMKEKIKYVENNLAVCAVFFLIIAIASFTIAEYCFVLFYGSAYQKAVPLFQMLLPLGLSVPFICCITSFISGIGMGRIAVYGPLSGCIFMVVSSFTLLYTESNLYSFIWAQNIAYFIYFTFYLHFFIKKWREA